MKKPINIFYLILLFLSNFPLFAQEEKPEPSVSIQYYNRNGNFQYLKVKVLLKENGKLKPLEAIPVKLYLDEVKNDNLIGTLKTDINGEAVSIIPPQLKDKWNGSVTHKFFATVDATQRYLAGSSETDIKKLKIEIDTLNEEGVRKVAAKIYAYDTSWTPVKDVEVKIAVKRLGGDLKIGDEESYSTDSTGAVSAEFKLDKLPATDFVNNLILVVKTEENDNYGNLAFEKVVPWGKYIRPQNDFNRRSLWATRNKAPLWLVFMANAIIIGVWSVIIYLVFQIRTIKKLGKKEIVYEKDMFIQSLETAEV